MVLSAQFEVGIISLALVLKQGFIVPAPRSLVAELCYLGFSFLIR